MAELTINTADIAAALHKNLDDFKPSVEAAQVGRVIEVGDGIATVSGLPGVGEAWPSTSTRTRSAPWCSATAGPCARAPR
jgi:hypothetical protein